MHSTNINEENGHNDSMTNWITARRFSNSRPVIFTTKIRIGMRQALNRYAKSEGVQVTDIIDTKLMSDPKLRHHLEAVKKESDDTTKANQRKEPKHHQASASSWREDRN